MDDPQLRGRYIVSVDGRWYLNPAYDEVVDLICAGAEEALRLYDFDGLHMDDYFYPTTDPSFDADAYASYQASGGALSWPSSGERPWMMVYQLHEMTENPGRADFGTALGQCGQGSYPVCRCVPVVRSGTARLIAMPPGLLWTEHGSYDFVKVCRTYQT